MCISTLSHTKQKHHHSRMSAKLFVEDQDGKQYTLKIYKDTLATIVSLRTISEDNPEENLIHAPPFWCIYYVIKTVSR